MDTEAKNNNSRKPANWYVITGGPGCGKTTTVNQLNMLGYHTTIEHARHFIDTQMITGKKKKMTRRKPGILIS